MSGRSVEASWGRRTRPRKQLRTHGRGGQDSARDPSRRPTRERYIDAKATGAPGKTSRTSHGNVRRTQVVAWSAALWTSTGRDHLEIRSACFMVSKYNVDKETMALDFQHLHPPSPHPPRPQPHTHPVVPQPQSRYPEPHPLEDISRHQHRPMQIRRIQRRLARMEIHIRRLDKLRALKDLPEEEKRKVNRNANVRSDEVIDAEGVAEGVEAVE